MSEFEQFDIESEFYATPRERTENPVDTVLKRGDVVRAKVGPAKGNVGIVVVERNANYVDSEPYASGESIGVRFAEKIQRSKELEVIIRALVKGNSTIHTVTRWFDSPDQLEIVEKATPDK